VASANGCEQRSAMEPLHISDYGQRMSSLLGDVRRFNRTVTEHIGVLSDHFLGRGLNPNEARLLWEIGPSGSELRALRARLDLDSGYLTRLVRSLVDAGLVSVVPSPAETL
jgi:DNA-binding MarR family transcriptional regulator